MKKLFVFVFIIISIVSNAQENDFSSTEVNSTYENGTVLISYIGTYLGRNFQMSEKAYDPYLLGVYFDENDKTKTDPRYYKIPIKTKGITYVKFNNENGEIKAGDPVTSSSTPGVAMKATEPGIILGIALEDSDKAYNGLLKIRILIQYMR
ncbi:MAG: hypothetical protein Kow0068_10980 [Marinilabiliales bacterium]